MAGVGGVNGHGVPHARACAVRLTGAARAVGAAPGHRLEDGVAEEAPPADDDTPAALEDTGAAEDPVPPVEELVEVPPKTPTLHAELRDGS